MKSQTPTIGTESGPRMRPRFQVPLSVAADTAMGHIEGALNAPGSPVEGWTFKGDVHLQMPESKQHFWSPRLDLHIVEREGRVLLRGRFGPAPSVWTAFMALYATLTLVAIAGGVWGVAQSVMGGSLWAFLAIPVAFALIGFIYGAAFIGQGLGAGDSHIIRAFVESALTLDIERDGEDPD